MLRRLEDQLGPNVTSFLRVHLNAAHENEDFRFEALAGDGSDRKFYRLWAGAGTMIMVYGPDPAENRAYELIGRHLWRLGRIGPEFLAADQASGLFLIEDLGDVLLQDLAAGVDDSAQRIMYEKAVDLLVLMHSRGLSGFDTGWCYQTRRYDRALILERESGYFLAAFVRGYAGEASGLDQGALGLEFEALAQAALEGTETVLMHRDFQSRNLMIKDARLRVVDFQGARLGPPGYDLASLLFDPYVKMEDRLQAHLFQHYLRERKKNGPFEEPGFRRTYPCLAACRLMQALGAYGYLSRVRGKKAFAAYIPAALGFLARLLEEDKFDILPQTRLLVGKISRKLENYLF
ncbi:MAG: phosphotransferase [Pseudomonadota bacterium]